MHNFLSFFWSYISFFKNFLSYSFAISFELLCGKVYETFITMSAILLPTRLPVASAVFWITFFELVLSAPVAGFLAILRRFWLYLPLKFLLIFLPIFYPYFTKRQKSINFYKYSISRLEWIVYHFLYFYYLINKLMFVLSSFSSGLEFQSVNHTSIYENSELNVFKIIKFLGEISSNWASKLFIRNKCIQDSWILLIIIVNNVTIN